MTTPILSQNKSVTIQPVTLPSNCIVYMIHETQGAESWREAGHIAVIIQKAINEYLKAGEPFVEQSENEYPDCDDDSAELAAQYGDR